MALAAADTALPESRRMGRGYWADVGRRLMRDPVAVTAA